MESNFGNIPLSKDILMKLHIGLWAFELDEGRPPRMYADDSILSLFGIKGTLSPEETYLEWYDNIGRDYYGLVADTISKMIDGEFVEIQYQWNCPNGDTLLIHCGGIRNYAYTDGIRIEGSHRDVTKVADSAEAKQREMKVQIDELTALSQYFVETYVSAYYVGLDDFSCVTYKRPPEIVSHYPIKSNWLDSINEYISKDVHPNDRAMMFETVKPETMRKRLAQTREYAVILRDISGGVEKFYRFQVIRGADSSHAAFGFIDISEEIYEENEKNLQIEKAIIEHERYNFLVNVAHELRTPLTLIIGPLERILRREMLSDKTRGVLNRVCRQAGKMTSLLNTILTTNSIEEGADHAKPEPIRFNQWIKAAADEFCDEAESHDMSIQLYPDPTIDVVNVDEHLFKIVFSNLISNAIHNNVQGSPIAISTSWSAGKEAVRVSVRDFGSNLDSVDVSKIFQQYYRTTEDKSGFGIGLAYSKTIIDAHNGKIGAYNNSDGKGGATFWVEIPADYGTRIVLDAENLPGAAPDFIRTEAETTGLKTKTILYVEDDKDLRDYIQSELKHYFKSVLTAANGQKALEVLDSNSVDIVLSDIMMPEIDGIDLCNIIKTTPQYSSLPVILLSARADTDSRKRGHEVKADYYLDKPFLIEDLINVLEEKCK